MLGSQSNRHPGLWHPCVFLMMAEAGVFGTLDIREEVESEEQENSCLWDVIRAWQGQPSPQGARKSCGQQGPADGGQAGPDRWQFPRVDSCSLPDVSQVLSHASSCC